MFDKHSDFWRGAWYGPGCGGFHWAAGFRPLVSVHHTLQARLRTIGCPSWQPNAARNCGRFATTPLMR